MKHQNLYKGEPVTTTAQKQSFKLPPICEVFPEIQQQQERHFELNRQIFLGSQIPIQDIINNHKASDLLCSKFDQHVMKEVRNQDQNQSELNCSNDQTTQANPIESRDQIYVQGIYVRANAYNKSYSDALKVEIEYQVQIHAEAFEKVARKLNVNSHSIRKLIYENKRRIGKKYKHQKSYMDLNCPILKEIFGDHPIIKQAPKQCSLNLYIDETDSLSIFKTAQECPFIRIGKKKVVRELFEEWQQKPYPNKLYLEKSKFKFFRCTFEHLNNVPNKRIRLEMLKNNDLNLVPNLGQTNSVDDQLGNIKLLKFEYI